MKQKKVILSLLIISSVLYGCNGNNTDADADADADGNESVEATTLQAYDGPVRGMIATISCEDNTTGIYQHTDDEGNISIPLATFVTAPETCSVELRGDINAVDMFTGKDLSGVTYTIPKGLLSAGQKATASPLTTLITTSLDSAAYNDSTAIEVFQALGLGAIANRDAVSVKEVLTDTQGVIVTLESNKSLQLSKLIATNQVLSDIISATRNSPLPADIVSRAAHNLSEVIVARYPNFPKNNDVANPKEIYFDFRVLSDFISILRAIADTPSESILEKFLTVKMIIDSPLIANSSNSIVPDTTTPDVGTPTTPDTTTPDVGTPTTPDTTTPDVGTPTIPDIIGPGIVIPTIPDIIGPGIVIPPIPDIIGPGIVMPPIPDIIGPA